VLYYLLKSKSFLVIFGIIVPISLFLLVFLATQMCTTGCAGELGPQYSSSWADDGSYSWKRNALSDLGVSKVANLFNYTLIIGGILMSILGIGIVRSFKSKLYSVGALVFIVASISFTFIGVYTEEAGILHLYPSIGFFILAPISIIIFGGSFLKNKMKNVGITLILLGILSLITISSFSNRWHEALGLGFGVPEMIEAFLIVLSIILLSRTILSKK